jgi:tetratricopeptide (TPR) repeat protein
LKSIRIAGLILLFVTAGAVPARADASAHHIYLLMPFANVAEDPSLDWLSTGLALSLGEFLRGAGAQVIDDEMRAALLEAHGIPPGADLTLASILQLGRTMRTRSAGPQPDHTLVGTFNITDGELTLRARWIHLQREYAGPWHQQEGRLGDLLEVHARLARDLAEEIELPRPARDEQRAGAEAFGDPPLLAFESYCRGMAETDTKERLKLLRQAVNEFPGYHRAAYQAAALLAKTARWNDAALMLDKAAADPHPYRYDYFMLKAIIAMEQHRPEIAAQAALDASEVHDTADAQILLCRARLAGGDRAAARAAFDRAAAINPDNPELDNLRAALSAAGSGDAVR